MEIFWNGTARELAEETTVTELLTACGMKPETVVIELNGEIFTAEEAPRVLKAGDRLNAFRIVAGG